MKPSKTGSFYTLKKLIGYFRKHLPFVLLALLFTTLETILQVIAPNKLKALVDEITKTIPMTKDVVPEQMDLHVIKKIAFILIILYVASFLFSYFQSFITTTITHQISQKMRSDIVHKIDKLPLNYFDKNDTGDILSRITNDVDAAAQALNQSLVSLLSASIVLIGISIMMFYNNLILAITTIIANIFGFIFMPILMTKSQKLFTHHQESLGKINAHIEEMYSEHAIIKIYNYGEIAKIKFQNINEDLYDASWKSQFLSGLMIPLMSFMGNFSYVVVCIVGTVLAVEQIISFGVIIAFILYARMFTQPLSQITQLLGNLQRAVAASNRVFQFLDEEEMAEEDSKDKKLEAITGNIEFSHVRFGYEKEHIIIQDFSNTVKAGEKIAIVGPTGAGKSTLINLLLRFYELQGGEILIDKIPIRELTREELRKQFSIVLQDSWIFYGSIKENIVFSKEDVSDDEVVSVCKTIGLHHFISTLPEAYNTVLNEKNSISEGQKQLISIARAMIHNAPILILDEATAAIDTHTEQIIQNAMDKLIGNRTSFVIAHRLSTIKNADKILVINKGEIVESGTHTELLQKNGFYAELYQNQFL